ncbi:hypothetical protein HYW20_05670 [Candidatus Woesearchaeota archaeon]|nr:hypothetical protein [Candidatus Woesearchaeota archaeon]
MKIDFYEEFPTKENLDKIKLISFPAKLIVAAKSLEEFHSIQNNVRQYKNRNVKEVAYWPILAKDEGYWFSAFTKNSALKRIINELQQNKRPLTVMWDAELPFYKSTILKYLLNYIDYFKNRRIILSFFRNAGKYNIKILTSEYPLESGFFRRLLFELFLISFDPRFYNNKKIIMLYTSLLRNHPNVESFLENQTKIGKKYFGKDLIVGLGIIATGIGVNEPILKVEDLKRDLKIVKDIGVEEVVIYRLSGLNKNYINVIKKYNS